VAVDTLDGATHRTYGPLPNSAYLIDTDQPSLHPGGGKLRHVPHRSTLLSSRAAVLGELRHRRAVRPGRIAWLPLCRFAVDGKQYVATAAGWGGWVKGFALELLHAPRTHTLLMFAL
jgi:hypothetical protein